MISPSSLAGTLEYSPGTAASRPSAIQSPEAIHDAGLIARFNLGDDTAFSEIAERHRRRIFAVALSTLRNRADAEEIVQDTLVRAHRGLATFRGDCSLATWLRHIALNLARNRYWYFFRRHRQNTRSFDCAFSETNPATFAELTPSDAADPAREAAKREFAAQITACMAKLNARHRQILTLRNIDEATYEDIAAALRLSPGTVKSRIARARTCLRSHLAEAYGYTDAASSPAFPWFEVNRPASAP